MPIHVFPAKHSAFSMTLPGTAAVPKPLHAPGRVRVAEIWEASFSTGGRNYQIYVYPCSQVRVYFGHVASLSDRLLAEFNREPPKCNSFNDGTATVTTCRREGLSLQLEPGEVLGWGPDTAGIDFGLADFRRIPAAFVVPDHYDAYYPYWAAPVEYFEAEPRAALEAKTGSVFGNRLRTAAPIGGTHMQDVAGTAQGNWFTGGKTHRTTTDLSAFLSLAHDYVVPAQPIMAIGNSIAGVAMGLYSFPLSESGVVNRDFDRIAPDGRTYCFEHFLSGQSAGGLPLTLPGGVIMLALPSATTMKVEYAAGGTCTMVSTFTFGPKATAFER